MKTNVDIRLERDPRYAAAKARLYELMGEQSALERDRDAADAGLSSMVVNHASRIEREASALLTGAPAPDRATLDREAASKTLTELTHRMAVIRQAIVMQRQIVDELRSEVGKQIATDLLPQHRANVAAVVKAALQLSHAMEQEDALRRTLYDANAPDCGILRPMTMPGVGLIRDSQSRIVRFLVECEANGFCNASDLPDIVRAQIVPKAKPTPTPVASRANADGWVNATA